MKELPDEVTGREFCPSLFLALFSQTPGQLPSKPK
jgi:hypothetical protein